jgi:STE24 endopeptidase
MRGEHQASSLMRSQLSLVCAGARPARRSHVNEDKATRYHRLRRRVQALSLLTTTTLLIVVVAGGAGTALRAALDRLAAGAGAPPGHSLTTVILFTLLLTVLLGIAALPFRVFGEWLLERRYGLERVPFSTWLGIYARTAIVGIGFALVAGLLPALAWRLSEGWWWLLAALAAGAGQVGLATATPLLLNWFTHVRPVQRADLAGRLRHLADRAGARGGLRVYEWPEASSGRRAQAVLMGLGRTRRVLLSDTLLAAFADEEIEVVVAHELSHHVHRDLWKLAAARGALFVIAFAVIHGVLAAIGASLGLHGPADAAALPLILLVVGLTMAAASPVMSAWSRAHERRADAFALRLTGNAEALLSVLRRLGALNLAEERPSALSALLASHPPLPERVAAVVDWQTRRSRA